MRYVFFGTSQYSVITLKTLKKAGLSPVLIVTTPDKPKGRGLILTPSPVKIWAEQENIPLLQPDKLKDSSFIEALKKVSADIFIVISYGKIIPQEVIDVAPKGALNIHASLLPKLRGASPLETAILNDEKETGVTIMQIDAEMDHGPIIAQKKVVVEPWPPTAVELGEKIVQEGSDLLVEILPDWENGKIKAKEQDHSQATYTEKIEKADGEIDLAGDAYQNFLKIQAFAEWPTAYFFMSPSHKSATAPEAKKIRVIIKSAKFSDGKLEILRVVPEGKKEMDYKEFTRNQPPRA